MKTEGPLSYSFIPVKSLPSKLPRHQVHEKFLAGPIPMDWLTLAGRLPGKTFQLAIALWHLGFLNNGLATFKLSYIPLREMGVERKAVYRGLEALERIGLIRCELVQRRPVKADIGGSSPSG